MAGPIQFPTWAERWKPDLTAKLSHPWGVHNSLLKPRQQHALQRRAAWRNVVTAHPGLHVTQSPGGEVSSYCRELVCSGPLSTFLCAASVLPLRCNSVENCVHSLNWASFRSEVGKEEPGCGFSKASTLTRSGAPVQLWGGGTSLCSLPRGSRVPCSIALLSEWVLMDMQGASSGCCGLKNQSQAELTCFLASKPPWEEPPTPPHLDFRDAR